MTYLCNLYTYNINAVKYNNATITRGSKNVTKSGIKSHDNQSVKSTSIYSTKKIYKLFII